MKILVLDNFDSFTYNLVQYLKELTNHPIVVKRNNEISIGEIDLFDTIILSPGPGIPSEAGIMPELIKTYASDKSILGVCLGHQAIGEAFGAKLENMSYVFHGVSTKIIINEKSSGILYQDFDKEFEAGRYHSWLVSSNDLPESLVITSVDEEGRIMSLSHKSFDIHGVQFHPESIMTPKGKQILLNFLNHAFKRCKDEGAAEQIVSIR